MSKIMPTLSLFVAHLWTRLVPARVPRGSGWVRQCLLAVVRPGDWFRRRNLAGSSMRHRFLFRIALPFLFVFLTAPAIRALEPLDAFPPTTFSVSLVVRPPSGKTFT